MSLRQQFLRGALWSAAEKWGAQLASTAVFLLLARLLDAKSFGLIALANVFLSLMQILLDQGFAQAIVQRQNLEPEHLDTAFWTSVLMGMVFVVAILSGAGWIAQFYQEPMLAPIIQCMSLSFLLAGLSSVQSAILQRNMQFKAFAIRSLGATVACGVAGLGAALLGFGVWSLVIKELVFGSTASLLLWVQSDWRPGLRFSPQHFRDLFSFGISVIGFNGLNFLNRHADDMLIGYFLGSVALGYYSVAYRLILIMSQLFTQITTQVSLPTFSRLQHEPERLRSMYYKITQATSLVSIPAFVSLSVLAPTLIPVFFGDQWIPSIPTMRILALAGTIQTVYAFNGTVLLSMNKPFWRLILQFTHAVTNLLVFVIVVRWGIAMVALGYVVRGYVLFPLPLFMMKRLLTINLHHYFAQYGPSMLGTSAMVAAMLGMQYWLRDSYGDPITLMLCSVTGALAYIAVIRGIHPTMFQQIRADIVTLGKH